VTAIPRCQQRAMHQTHDASEGAARKLEIALLRPETRLSCACGNGESRPADCARVYAHDSSGVHVATFHGLGLGAQRMTDGSVCVYRMPGATKDAGKPLTLADLNKIHAEFYRRGEL
jgi:hypothetical protein